MESFKSISAIDNALSNIESTLTEMASNIKTLKEVRDNFESAWKSQESLGVQAKINELTNNLDALQKGVMNIKIKVNNAKSLAVAANTTVFAGNGGSGNSERLNNGPKNTVYVTKQ
ncbi:MAG: hypothetical protein J6X02_04825 [Bacilli bacterium]|nr:hypothetical protein [Bacilli bacterium]